MIPELDVRVVNPSSCPRDRIISVKFGDHRSKGKHTKCSPLLEKMNAGLLHGGAFVWLICKLRSFAYSPKETCSPQDLCSLRLRLSLGNFRGEDIPPHVSVSSMLWPQLCYGSQRPNPCSSYGMNAFITPLPFCILVLLQNRPLHPVSIHPPRTLWVSSRMRLSLML